MKIMAQETRFTLTIDDSGRDGIFLTRARLKVERGAEVVYDRCCTFEPHPGTEWGAVNIMCHDAARALRE